VEKEGDDPARGKGRGARSTLNRYERVTKKKRKLDGKIITRQGSKEKGETSTRIGEVPETQSATQWEKVWKNESTAVK